MFGHACGFNATAVRQMIGYLPTHPSLPGHLFPIESSLGVPREDLPSFPGGGCTASFDVAAHGPVGLLGATEQRIQTFSTGMRTRLGIAASLLADPPLAGVGQASGRIGSRGTSVHAGSDPRARAKTRTVVVATHILSDIDQICDHVGVMLEGRMIFSGSMADMKRRLRHDDFYVDVDAEPAPICRALVGPKPHGLAGFRGWFGDSRTASPSLPQTVSRRSGTIAELMGLLEGSRSLTLRRGSALETTIRKTLTCSCCRRIMHMGFDRFHSRR